MIAQATTKGEAPSEPAETRDRAWRCHGVSPQGRLQVHRWTGREACTAVYVDRILRGEKPSDVPVQ
jgi:hypothetical protein